MHWLLFIHKILVSSTCFEHQVLIFRRIQLYTCSIWYCHSLWEFLVACRYTAWVRTDWRGKVVGGCLWGWSDGQSVSRSMVQAFYYVTTCSSKYLQIHPLYTVHIHECNMMYSVGAQCRYFSTLKKTPRYATIDTWALRDVRFILHKLSRPRLRSCFFIHLRPVL